MYFALRKKEEKRRKAKWEGERMKGEGSSRISCPS